MGRLPPRKAEQHLAAARARPASLEPRDRDVAGPSEFLRSIRARSRTVLQGHPPRLRRRCDDRERPRAGRSTRRRCLPRSTRTPTTPSCELRVGGLKSSRLRMMSTRAERCGYRFKRRVRTRRSVRWISPASPERRRQRRDVLEVWASSPTRTRERSQPPRRRTCHPERRRQSHERDGRDPRVEHA